MGTDEPGSLSGKASLVFQTLLRERHEEAIRLYEESCTSDGELNLAGHLDEKDYRDCLFLLGEAYEEQGQPKRALRFYETVYELERKRPLRYFLDELCRRILAIRGG